MSRMNIQIKINVITFHKVITRQGRGYTIRDNYISLLSETHRLNTYSWVIDQVCSVKMAGDWPSSFFGCLWTETNIILRKKE